MKLVIDYQTTTWWLASSVCCFFSSTQLQIITKESNIKYHVFKICVSLLKAQAINFQIFELNNPEWIFVCANLFQGFHDQSRFRSSCRCNQRSWHPWTEASVTLEASLKSSRANKRIVNKSIIKKYLRVFS